MSPGCPLRQTLRCAQGDKWDGPFRRGRRMSGGAKILRCGLKCTTPRLVYASLVASERKLRMTVVEARVWQVAPMVPPSLRLARGQAVREAKGLTGWAGRSFAALRMTRMFFLPHSGQPWLICVLG